MKNTYKKFIAGILGVIAISTASLSYAAVPTMLTMPASNVSQTDAVLNGTFNANGSAPMDVRFEYGTTTKLGQSTPYTTMAAANGSYNVKLTGLSPNTTYYFRAMGVNADGPDVGTILDFTTAGYSMPSAITTPASNISQTGATLNGTFNGNGLVTDTWFEYSTNSSLSGYISTPGVSQSATYGNMSESLISLNPNTTYYFRAVARTTGGTKRSSAILSFTTSNTYIPPNNCAINSLTSNTYNVSSGNPAYLSWNTTNCTNATLSPSGYTALSSSGFAVYPNSTTTYTLYASNSTSSDSRSITITVNNRNVKYYCEIDYFRASDYDIEEGQSVYLSWDTTNCSGVRLSPGSYRSSSANRYRVYPSYPSTRYTLTTLEGERATITIDVYRNGNRRKDTNSYPTVNTSGVSSITSGSALLHGYANGNGSGVSVWFEYGTTQSLGRVTSVEYGGNATNANGSIGGLKSGTTYFYRLVARNSYGTSYGSIMHFTTNPVYTNNGGGGNGGGGTVINNTRNTNNSKNENVNNDSNENGGDFNGVDRNNLTASAGSAGFSIFPHTLLGWMVLLLIILAIVIIVKQIRSSQYHDRGI